VAVLSGGPRNSALGGNPNSHRAGLAAHCVRAHLGVPVGFCGGEALAHERVLVVWRCAGAWRCGAADGARRLVGRAWSFSGSASLSRRSRFVVRRNHLFAALRAVRKPASGFGAVAPGGFGDAAPNSNAVGGVSWIFARRRAARLLARFRLSGTV